MGKEFGIRNAEGEMLLEFADAMGLTVCNTWFTKKDSQKVTYESGGCKTVVDYVLIRREERQMISNVTVIQVNDLCHETEGECEEEEGGICK